MSGKSIKISKRVLKRQSKRMYDEFFAMAKKQPFFIRVSLAWEIITKKNA